MYTQFALHLHTHTHIDMYRKVRDCMYTCFFSSWQGSVCLPLTMIRQSDFRTRYDKYRT